MTTFKFLFALLFLCSCKAKPADDKLVLQTKIDDTTKSTNTFSFVDTLNRYKGLDTLSKGNRVFYIGNTNSKSFGVFQTSDTTFIVFQQNIQGWVVSDTLKLADMVNVSYTDLNGDSYKDVLIAQDYTGAGGNSENVVLLYKPQVVQFGHNSSYDLPNIQYDKSKRLIYSAWWASANHPQDKMVYKMSGDSLLLDKGVTYIPDEQTQGQNGIVEFYTCKNNSRIVTKRTKGKAGKVFDVFTKAFWDTSDQ